MTHLSLVLIPILKLQHALFIPEMLQAKEHTPTPSFVVFTFGLAFESSRSLGVHHLNSTLASSNSSPISIRSCSMSSSYNVVLVLFLVAMLSQSLAICKVNHSTLPCAIFNSFHNFFSFATRSFRSFWWISQTFSIAANWVFNSSSH